METYIGMHLNKHFLFIIGAPALLVLLVAGAGLYRLSGDDDTAMPMQEAVEHVVHDEGADPQDAERVQIVSPHTDTTASAPAQTPATDDRGVHFSGVLQKVDTGCFADGECFVVVDGKHVTAVRGWSQEVVGTVQGVEGFGDLSQHIGAQVDVYAYGAGDSVYTLYGNAALYIRLATTSTPITQSAATTHISSPNERPEVQ
jgi:hypothetical protein